MPRLAIAVIVAFASAACAKKDAGFNPPVSATTTEADASGSAGAAPSRQPKGPEDATPDQTGYATWYGSAFAGHRTANGEIFDPSKLTAAHRKLPFGTWVEVRRVDTGRVIRVRINDRGPFGHADRIIDLSKKAAEDLEIIRDGVVKVEIRVVDGP